MIWFRRAMAILLALIFIILYIPLLVVFRVNDTAGNPAFYVDQLRRADAYNFIYDKVVPAALDDLQKNGDATVSANIATLKPEAVSFTRKALPPEWLQAQMEQVINKVLPYVLGDVDSFRVAIPVKDRVKEGAAALKETLHKPGIFSSFYEQVIAQLVDVVSNGNPADNNEGNLLGVDPKELETALRSTAPPDWLLQQIDNIVDQAVPYITRETEHFSVKIDISQRLDSLQQVMVDVFRRQELYRRLIDSVASTAVGQASSGEFGLPIGLVLSREEVSEVLTEALTLDWYEARVKDVVGQIFDYIKGKESTLKVAISLADRKAAVADSLAGLADRKLQAYIDNLPVATPAQTLQMIANPPIGRLPPYNPTNLSYQQLKTLLRIDVKAQIAPVLAAVVPDQIVLSEKDAPDILGEEGTIQQIRDLARNGWVVSDSNLSDYLGGDTQSLEDFREKISTGIVFTEQDLRDYVASGDSQEEKNASLRDFDNVRSYLGTFRHWKWVLWLIPALLLVAIGFLGGHKWSTRLLWVGGVLLATAIVAFVVFGPVFSSTASSNIDAGLNDMIKSSQGMSAVMAEKVAEVAHNSIGSFVGGLQRQAVFLLVVALVLIAVGVVMKLRSMNGHGHDY